MIRIANVSKQYRLGQIGGTTLRDELQRISAKIHHREDPTRRIGSREYNSGETFMALDNVSFDVVKGERVGIIGHNGAGKSTLLKLISRVTAPTCGWIGLNGRVASMLEVGTGFHGELTGRENIYMNGAILGMTRKEIDKKLDDIIEFSECRQFIDTPVKRYSSGMYVKLAFSVAAHLDSEILIMDEVLAVGDMAFQKKCLDKMNDVSRMDGRTILYVSHNMNTIRQLCDRCIVLEHGKIVFNGKTEEAIKMYLEVAGRPEVRIDYSNIEKVPWVLSNDVKLLSLEYPDKRNCVFSIDSIIRVKAKWQSYKALQKLRIRVVLETMAGTKVAASLSDEFDPGVAYELCEASFLIDLKSLAPGSYKAYYVLYLTDTYGHDVTLDWRRGMDIILEDDRKGSIPWRTNAWGYMMLPPPIIEQSKE